jgi:hypothetical protein
MVIPTESSAFKVRAPIEVWRLLHIMARQWGILPAAAFDQAIDELQTVTRRDAPRPTASLIEERVFLLTPSRRTRLREIAAAAGIGEAETAIAAIRQLAARSVSVEPPSP